MAGLNSRLQILTSIECLVLLARPPWSRLPSFLRSDLARAPEPGHAIYTDVGGNFLDDETLKDMKGGGFLIHGRDTSKANHDALRKTKDKKSLTSPNLISPGGNLTVEELTEEQKRDVADLLAKARKEDRRKAFIVGLISVTIVGLIVYLLFS